MICGLALLPIQNPGYAYALNHVQYAYRYRSLHLSIVGARWHISIVGSRALYERLLTTLQRCKATKYTLRCFQSKISLAWKYGMEYGKKILVWNGIWKKILVWNGIWNGRFLAWNGRKLPLWNMEKSSSIPFHIMSCLHNVMPFLATSIG